MVAKGDGLRPLQMGVTGHHRMDMLLRLIAQGAQQHFDLGGDGVNFIPKIKADIQRHLIVSASGSVKTFAGIADAGCQLRLHKHMDILRCGIKGKFAAFQILQDGLEPP